MNDKCIYNRLNNNELTYADKVYAGIERLDILLTMQSQLDTIVYDNIPEYAYLMLDILNEIKVNFKKYDCNYMTTEDDKK